MPARLQKEQAQDWLDKNHPQYKILDWGGSSRSESVFIDIERGVKFSRSFNDFKNKLKKNPSLIVFPTKEEYRNKYKKTMLEKHGDVVPLRVESIKNKAKVTNLSKYGQEHHWKNEQIREKIKKTNLFRRGVENPFGSSEVKKIIKNINIKKYGYENPQQNQKIRQKTKETNIQKYGFETPSKSSNIAKKISSSKTIHVYKGLSAVEWAQKLGISYTSILRYIEQNGHEGIEHLKQNKNLIDLKVENLFKDWIDNFVFNKSFENFLIRPDFVLPNQNIVIECDGLYWHSDAINKDKNYHKNKRKLYIDAGYFPFFFREDEIKNKIDIIKSLLFNKLGFNKKIGARQTKISESYFDVEFFEQNHLMGKGQGKIISLVYKDIIVSQIQIKWKNKNVKTLEISRFCNLNGYSIVGGLSKLLNYIIKKEKPNKIISFVDLRYGNGASLEKLNFIKTNEDLSFKWTDFKSTFNRTKFLGNSGYDHRLFKIWDCGQAKYELVI